MAKKRDAISEKFTPCRVYFQVRRAKLFKYFSFSLDKFIRCRREDDAVILIGDGCLPSKSNKDLFHKTLEGVRTTSQSHRDAEPFKGTEGRTKRSEVLAPFFHWQLEETQRHIDRGKILTSFKVSKIFSIEGFCQQDLMVCLFN